MTEDTSPLSPPCAPGDVVEQWQDLVLHCDAAGTVAESAGDALDHLPDSARAGQPFWEALRLGTGSLAATLRRFAPLRVHEVLCRGGRSFLLRVIPLPEKSGFVVVATDNRPLTALHETWEERLGQGITALSDSITLFNSFFDTARDAVLLVDEEGVVLAGNAAAVGRFAAPGRRMVGRSHARLLAPRSRVPVRRAMHGLGPDGLWSGAVEALDCRGEAFPAEAALRKVAFSDSSLFLLILHDQSLTRELEEGLRDREAEVEEMGIALRQVMRAVETEGQELRNRLGSQVRKRMLPALERIARTDEPEVREGYRSVIEEQLAGLIEGGPQTLDADLLRLSPREMEVCRLVQLGRSGKEIAELLQVSFETVQTHRKNIRKKLGLRGRESSLFAYLRTKASLS
ncbi:transcriptional regulator, LuxR family [Desulfovibrio sp. X2]|uniref:LuxR C-terminal-related transcriptional regulator n=1 Tax=Desulfovibrio sp. X2 TaxID=941449 RepID=UPI0003588C9B|nr:LuxR C-terminal-related transcriptional regulator [Desulfovibrio sp. X2]EPR43478.1 transcriptional regulator, LuxR family [Desulfovibrio sp. X2]